MILYILITIAAAAAAYLVSTAQKTATGSGSTIPASGTRAYGLYRSGMVLLFLILVIPAVLRQACGNDYMRYVEFFHLADVHAYVPTEPGFNAFVRLIYGLCGYENYILVFALFSIGTIALFLAAIRQQAQDFAASMLVFLLSGYYFQTYNTVRYYLALAAALFALRFFLERMYLPFVLCILLAASFHKSVLCVLVLFPLAALPWKKWQALLLAVPGALLTLCRTQVMALILRLYPSYEDTEILAAGGSPSWGNILRCMAILALYAVCRRACGTDGGRRDRRFCFYINAAWISLYIYVFAWFVPEISRIAYYLVITQIFFLPEMVEQIPDAEAGLRRRLKIAVGAACVAVFAVFLYKAYGVTVRILPYKSFLFHDLPATPSRSIH